MRRQPHARGDSSGALRARGAAGAVGLLLGVLLVLVLVLGVGASSTRAAAFVAIELEPAERVLGTALRDLDGDGRIDPVVAAGKPIGPGAMERSLVLYRLETTSKGATPSYVETGRLDLPDDVIAFGVGDFEGSGQSQILYFTARSLFAIDPQGGKPKRLLGGERFFFTLPAPETLPFWDGIQDLDGDGRDDLLLPLARGFGIWRQTEQGLEPAGRLEAERHFAIIWEEPDWGQVKSDLVNRRALNRVCLADANGDSRVDLISLRRKDLLAFHQSAAGTFPAEPSMSQRVISPTGIPFERLAEGWDRLPAPNVAFGDVNGDSRVDVVVPEIDVRGLATRLRVFIAGESGLPEKPTQIIKLSSLGDTPELVDINGDGALDLGCATVRTDMLKSLTQPSLDSVSFSYFGFFFDRAKGRFSARPDLRYDASYEIPDDYDDEARGSNDQEDWSQNERDRYRYEDPDGQGFTGFLGFPGDFDADGIRDLLTTTPDGSISVRRCVVSGASRTSVRIAESPLLEHELEAVSGRWVGDLDGDGRSDLAFTLPDRVYLLVTR